MTSLAGEEPRGTGFGEGDGFHHSQPAPPGRGCSRRRGGKTEPGDPDQGGTDECLAHVGPLSADLPGLSARGRQSSEGRTPTPGDTSAGAAGRGELITGSTRGPAPGRKRPAQEAEKIGRGRGRALARTPERGRAPSPGTGTHTLLPRYLTPAAHRARDRQLRARWPRPRADPLERLRRTDHAPSPGPALSAGRTRRRGGPWSAGGARRGHVGKHAHVER